MEGFNTNIWAYVRIEMFPSWATDQNGIKHDLLHGLSNFVVSNFCFQTSEFLHSLSLSPFGGNQNFNFMATMLQLKVAKWRLFEKFELSSLYKHSFEKQCATDHWWRSFTVTMDGQRQLFVEHQAQHLGLFFFVSKICWFFLHA